MKHLKRLTLLTIALLVCSSAPLLAYTLTAKDQQDLQRIETYMNAMPAVKADFVQQNSAGEVYTGQFWLQRPGRLRFEYKEPVKNFIVADGVFIHVWDAKAETQSSAPISETLADFILRKEVKMSGDVTVANIHREAGLISVTLAQKSEPAAGSLTLVFEDTPLQLKQWQVVDPQGRVSDVSLINPATNQKFDPRLFIFKKPGEK